MRRPVKPEKAVEKFNAAHSRGTCVEYRSSPSALPIVTHTSSLAWVLSGHTGVVMLDGVSGCVALFAVKVRA